MSKKVVDYELVLSDIRSLSGRARALKKKISKALVSEDSDIFVRIECALKNQGYDYKINRDLKIFVINVSNYFNILGMVSRSSIRLGIAIRYNGLEIASDSAQCGMIEIPTPDLEFYMPLVDKMVREGREITEKYENLLKKEKSATLIETLVRDYMAEHGVRNIDVNPDENGEIRAIGNIGDNIVARVPVDFDNYKSQCDAWIKVSNNPDLWKIEHKDTKVEVLKIIDEGTRPNQYWLKNLATGKSNFEKL